VQQNPLIDPELQPLFKQPSAVSQSSRNRKIFQAKAKYLNSNKKLTDLCGTQNSPKWDSEVQDIAQSEQKMKQIKPDRSADEFDDEDQEVDGLCFDEDQGFEEPYERQQQVIVSNIALANMNQDIEEIQPSLNVKPNQQQSNADPSTNGK
jgi:predicted secreted protein